MGRASHAGWAGIGKAAAVGAIAGSIFLAAETLAAALTARDPLAPFRLPASIGLGPVALSPGGAAVSAATGLAVHYGLSVAYGVMAESLARALLVGRPPLRWMAVLGGLFGALVWLVNFGLIAPVLFPWFVRTDLSLQFFLHVVFFGCPLGMGLGVWQRRLGRRRPSPVAS
jgi:hypothetical protein